MLKNSDAVPVKSCWGGMVAYDAAGFWSADVLFAGRSENEKTWKALQRQRDPLRFRHQGEIYWEESECCLISADLAQRTNPENAKILIRTSEWRIRRVFGTGYLLSRDSRGVEDSTVRD